MQGKFIGVEMKSGTNKEGKQFGYSMAHFTTEFKDKDRSNGLMTHSVRVPDEYLDVLKISNVGKTCELKFYYANFKEYLAYVDIK